MGVATKKLIYKHILREFGDRHGLRNRRHS